MLVDEDSTNGARCETILAKLRFAVAPAHSVDEALRVMDALRPNVIVARVAEISRLRNASPAGVPLVVITDELTEPDAMIEAIRQAIRGAQTV
jgi:DNA-binding response OmpR family regulator